MKTSLWRSDVEAYVHFFAHFLAGMSCALALHRLRCCGSVGYNLAEPCSFPAGKEACALPLFPSEGSRVSFTFLTLLFLL